MSNFSNLFKNRSFFCFLATQALGAFNDNLFKQLVLLLGVGAIFIGVDYQAVVQFVFALPFLVFSGLAGAIADRYSKGKLMVACKVAEVLIALLGVLAFLQISANASYFFDTPVYLLLLAFVVCLLGTQSAFFGPPKYGGLPELVSSDDLSAATGLTQMTTFLAIIFGVALAGVLADQLKEHMYISGLITVSIAVVGTFTSLGIKRYAPAAPEKKITVKACLGVFSTLKDIITTDSLLARVIIIYSWFWFVGGVALTATNAYGRLQLGMNNFETSMMVAVISLGIAVGSFWVGKISSGKIPIKLIIPAMLVLILCLLVLAFLPVHNPTLAEMEMFNQLKNSIEVSSESIFPLASLPVRIAAFVVFFILGGASGVYSVPLLAFIQARPDNSQKGSVFAAVNWLNWVFIFMAATAYGLGMVIFSNQANHLMAGLAGLNCIMALLFFPGLMRLLKQELHTENRP